MELRTPDPMLYLDVLERALREDLGLAGDLTTDAIVPPSTAARARLVTRAPGRVAGMAVVEAVFRLVDPATRVEVLVEDGSDAEAGEALGIVTGSARAVLTAERTALNLLGRLSGIATATRSLVSAVAGTGAGIADTRKTTPGLRALEKYAVRCGGGVNHRFGLFDAVLIKDNHLALAGSVAVAVERVRAQAGHLVKVEVEVDDLDQLQQALALPIDAVLLDNMDPETLRRAVALVDGRVVTEASGGMTASNIRTVAETGVDLISVGWITHSAPSLDVGLDFEARDQ
jgi:nicotinate-nucleotide pyrophosphorylase (carboxylating)